VREHFNLENNMPIFNAVIEANQNIQGNKDKMPFFFVGMLLDGNGIT